MRGLLCYYLVATDVCAFLESQYLKTKVLEDLNTCKNDNYHHFISMAIVSSIIECGRLCSSANECRRFMLNIRNNMCMLYESGENCFSSSDRLVKYCYRQKSICDEGSCVRCPIGYYGDRCQHIIEDCSDGFERDVVPQKYMLSFISPVSKQPPIEVKCQFQYGGLTLIQYRNIDCLEVNFNRSWEEYVHGFGNIHGNYWLGLENIHNIGKRFPRYKLCVVLTAGDVYYQGYYYEFKIFSSTDDYRVHIVTFDDDPGDSTGDALTKGIYNINGRPFSTYDRDSTSYECPGRFQAGWWYLDDPVCSRSNVNGRRSADVFEATWHWLDNLGNRTDFSKVILRLLRH